MINPLYHRCHFLISAATIRDAPPDEGFEVAFAGRSNAGKSSAINTITAQKSLARTSKTPGRTQLINFFAVDESRRLIDLPGYGYAKVSATRRSAWHRAVEDYMIERRSLRGIFLMMDIRHPLTPFDNLMIDWCRQLQLPIHVLLTKADKLGRGAGKSILMQVERVLRAGGEGRATVQLFSAFNRLGVDEAHVALDEFLDLAGSETAQKTLRSVKGGSLRSEAPESGEDREVNHS